ncbi:hypothetical protein O9X81_00410 [Agrobacterium salinitolerans]|uniref:hypothetical protein n=1 Tax=Agrobacterium salinitolerans TaxID=1183413 RepID=UPI0022B84507|nr:hypothetical protein [Agrobacterium salinitolerans]MCZ7855070.1 hypothetical protein [Agrobacterium salinitolerans]
MSEDTKALLFWLTYIAVGFVVFGFLIAKTITYGPGTLIISGFVAAFWPASGLIWLGAWLA